jgi:hypothetical protein
MSKFLAAAVIAYCAIGLNTATAKNITAAQANAKAWKDFEVQVDKCKAMTGTQRTQCMENLRTTYRSSNFDCDTLLSAQDKAKCQQFVEHWDTSQSQDSATVARSGEPNTAPPNPGAPSGEFHNGDSRKQEGNAVITLPEPQRHN